MKAGDLVDWNGNICLVTEVYESKCWRTDERGKAINWGEIPHEPFARILFKGDLRGIPQADLSLFDEDR